MPDLIPSATYFATMLMLAVIGVPFFIVGKRLAHDPAAWVGGFFGYPILAPGLVVAASSVGCMSSSLSRGGSSPRRREARRLSRICSTVLASAGRSLGLF